MSLVLRLKKGDAASHAAPLADETVPEVLPPPEPALLDWATLTPAADSHLVPCPQCGAPNGLSASSCWSCEADLLPLESIRRRRAPPTAALVPTHVPADADESLPVLTLAVKGNDATAERAMTTMPAPAPAPTPAPASMPPPAVDGGRHAGVIGASVLVVAVAAMAAALYFDTPAPAGAAKSGGFISPPEPAALATARPSPTPPADVAGVVNAPPVVAEASRTAALRALAVEPDAPTAVQPPPAAAIDLVPDHSATPPAAPAASKTAHVGKVRSTSRSANTATALALPKRDRPDPSATLQAPAPVRAACTTTVAALGLCTGPPTPNARPVPTAPTAPVAPTESKE